MDINSARLIYFSPTRTTRTVVEGIAQGLRIVTVEHVDLTPPDAMTRKLAAMHGRLTNEQHEILSRTAESCPVHRTLSGEISFEKRGFLKIRKEVP
jgi:hypothetical protein